MPLGSPANPTRDPNRGRALARLAPWLLLALASGCAAPGGGGRGTSPPPAAPSADSCANPPSAATSPGRTPANGTTSANGSGKTSQGQASDGDNKDRSKDQDKDGSAAAKNGDSGDTKDDDKKDDDKKDDDKKDDDKKDDGALPDDAPPPFLLRNLRKFMQEDDPDGSGNGEDYEDRLRPRSDPKVDIRNPDPDTANFPNGAFTLPQGRVYLETSPISFYGPSKVSKRIYNWEFLLRYGLTDRLELRLFGNGFTNQYSRPRTTGFSPLSFDLKLHLWDEDLRRHLPAVGLEVYMETNFGSKAFNQGTQPSINLLFDHTLPFDFNFEWNAGIAGNLTTAGDLYYNLALQWSLEREIFEDFSIFAHGFLNNAALPRFGQASRSTAADVLVQGLGAIWTVTDRVAIFGSFNFGLTPDSPHRLALLGTAFAF